MHKRRKYSQEYKQEAVQLVGQSDISLAQVAINLGINPSILRYSLRITVVCPLLFPKRVSGSAVHRADTPRRVDPPQGCEDSGTEMANR